MTQQIMKRGILQQFHPGTCTADVLIIEATSYALSNVPIATSVDGTSAIAGASCVVLFLDAHNPTDAIILAVYGVAPNPTPGRVVFGTPTLQLNAVSIGSGVTNTYTLSNIPAGALGVLLRGFFVSGTVGAWVGVAPHGATINTYFVLGDTQVASVSLNGNGVVPVDSSGRVDVKANNGTCNVTLYTYGYVF